MIFSLSAYPSLSCHVNALMRGVFIDWNDDAVVGYLAKLAER
jgi:hypothetical protein